MANGTLESLFREPKNRMTDRAAFAQALSRLSAVKSTKDTDERKSAKGEEKAA